MNEHNINDCCGQAMRVIDSRAAEEGRTIRRRRKCEKCLRRITTYEREEYTGYKVGLGPKMVNRLLALKPYQREGLNNFLRVLLEEPDETLPLPDDEPAYLALQPPDAGD